MKFSRVKDQAASLSQLKGDTAPEGNLR